MDKFKLTVAIPEKKLFDGEAESVSVPGEEGEMTILAGHAPLLSPLKGGEVKVIADSGEKTFKIDLGFIEVNNEGVTVLVKETPQGKDVQR